MSRPTGTRTAILEAALRALEEDPRAVNVRRVAQIAQCSRQAVYLHFANRPALLIAVARYVDQRLDLERHLAPHWTTRSAGDWLTAQASVKVWEELVMDLGYSSSRFVKVMSRSFVGALLTRTPRTP